MGNRVVVTGFGVITPFGLGETPLRERLYRQQNAFKPVTSFDTSACVAKFAAEAPVDSRSYQAFGRYCTEQALARAGLSIDKDRELLQEAVVAVGNLGDGAILESYYKQFISETGPGEALQERFSNPVTKEEISIFDTVPSSHAEAIAAYIGSQGPRVAFTNACVASANAIGYGFDQIRRGRTACALVGGIHVLYPKVFYNFDSSRALAERIVRPFSKDRTGLLIGDGAAMLVLEERESALRRGAKPIAEILGYGVSSDGFHVSQPEPDGKGLARAMRMALRKAGLQPGDIDYVNAHGTGTPLNDRSETRACKEVFGDGAARVPISSTKSMTGHMLEATGAVEAVISLLALTDQRIPPTANYTEPDEELDLDYVTDGVREAKLRVVMSNSSAFGGNNCSLLFRKEGVQ